MTLGLKLVTEKLDRKSVFIKKKSPKTKIKIDLSAKINCEN